MNATAPGVVGGALLAILLATGCDPPGKPKAEAQNLNPLVEFETLFSQNCSGCHGDNGRYGPVRPLNDPSYLAVIPRTELQNVIDNGRAGTSMPAWSHERGGSLDARQITLLIDGMLQRWAKPGKGPINAPSYLAEDRKGDTEAGRKLFTANCSMCHGERARIGSVTNPSYLSLTSDQGLRTSIIAGRLDLGMPNYVHLNRGGPLLDQDVTDLVAYLASLRPGNDPSANAHRQESATKQTAVTESSQSGRDTR